MTLTDTGPLVALVDSNDVNHAVCIEVAANLPDVPMLTTWPCFTEASYLLGCAGGFHFQSQLWEFCQSGSLMLHDLLPAQIQRVAALMGKYQDTPMSLADASLVAVAESISMTRIFTLDGDFRIYRLRNGTVLDIIP
jgi:uncharacterized protein